MLRTDQIRQKQMIINRILEKSKIYVFGDLYMLSVYELIIIAGRESNNPIFPD
jgi:hypothetical protein